MRTVFTMNDPIFSNSVKKMAYGIVTRGVVDPVQSGQLFRVERGAPYQRSGKLVVATPQFKAQTIYSPTSGNSQLPTKATNPTAIQTPRGIHVGPRGALLP